MGKFKKGHKINLGKHHPKESYTLFGKKIKELWKTPEYREKVINSLKGKSKPPRTLQHKENLSLANKRKHRSPETEFKKGNKHTENWKEMRSKQVGENSPVWQGGISFEKYTANFNRLFKEAIKQRDNFTCFKCNIFETDAKKLYNKNLAIHHIDYIKKNTIKENCCSLCIRCNAEVNFNRTSWTKFFQSLLTEKYGYNYSEILEVTNA